MWGANQSLSRRLRCGPSRAPTRLERCRQKVLHDIEGAIDLNLFGLAEVGPEGWITLAVLPRIHAGLFSASFVYGLGSIATLETEGTYEVITNEQGIFGGELLNLGENDSVILPVVRSGGILGIGQVGVGGLSAIGDDGKSGATRVLVEAGEEVEASVEAGSQIEPLRPALFAGVDT